MDLRIGVFGEISEAQGQLLSALVEELLPLAAIPDLRHLKGIVVVPTAGVEAAVNALRGGNDYKIGPFPVPATAVPVGRDGSLACFVVLSLGDVALLAPDRAHPYRLVSALLEELLHVRVYVTGWQQRGQLDPPHLDGRERDLFALCSNVHDEYVVSREKASISLAHPIYDHPNQPGMRTPLVLSYGGRVAESLADAGEELAALSRRCAEDGTAPDEKWSRLTMILHRLIFEPLAREAGFRAGIGEAGVFEPNDATNVPFYRDRVAPYWEAVLGKLDRSFRTGLRDMDQTLDGLVLLVHAFIGDLGLVEIG